MQTVSYPDYVNYLLSLGYDKAVEYLKGKYGKAKMPYFQEDSYQKFLDGKLPTPVKNKVTRTNEGLYCHHVREDKGILLSTPKAIRRHQYPYEWQQPENLVYVNILEHLVLHALIAMEQKDADSVFRLGIGGYINFMRPEMIQWFIQEKVPTVPWKRNCYNALSNMDKDEFKLILLRLDSLLIQNRVTTNVELSRALFAWLSNDGVKDDDVAHILAETQEGR